MFKNIFKFAVVGSLVLNPLISKAESQPADRMSANQEQEQEIIRADVRTQAGREAIVSFFMSLSLDEQREYLANAQQNHKELKKKLEQTQMQLRIANANDYKDRYAYFVPANLMYWFLAPGLLVKHKYIARELLDSKTFKSMNPKFLKGGVLFSGVMVSLSGYYLIFAGIKQTRINEAEMQKISSAISLIKEELEFERNMIDLLKAYSESNQ